MENEGISLRIYRCAQGILNEKNVPLPLTRFRFVSPLVCPHWSELHISQKERERIE